LLFLLTFLHHTHVVLLVLSPLSLLAPSRSVFCNRQPEEEPILNMMIVKNLLTLTALVIPFSEAANVKLKGGANAEPSFFDGGLTLKAAGELSGLGNEQLRVTLEADADVLSTCTNQGGNQAPGQNPAPITVTGSVTIDPDKIDKNGNAPFSVVTVAPEPNPIPGAPGCPNQNWTELIEDLKFTSAKITVEQPEEVVVLVVDCTIDPPSSNGDISKNDVTCTQTQFRLRG
jgi:hypothetical protein